MCTPGAGSHILEGCSAYLLSVLVWESTMDSGFAHNLSPVSNSCSTGASDWHGELSPHRYHANAPDPSGPALVTMQHM